MKFSAANCLATGQPSSARFVGSHDKLPLQPLNQSTQRMTASYCSSLCPSGKDAYCSNRPLQSGLGRDTAEQHAILTFVRLLDQEANVKDIAQAVSETQCLQKL